MPRLFLSLLLALPLAIAQSPFPGELTNPAVIVHFREGGHNRLAHFTEVLRYPVEGAQDLLLVWGGVQGPAWIDQGNAQGIGRSLWWNQTDVMGLFLEERGHPERVHLLSLLLNDSRSCVVEVVRIAPGELTLGRAEENGGRLESLKFFFDAGARRISRKIEYLPFSVVHIAPDNGSGPPRFVAGDRKRFVVARPVNDERAARGPAFEMLPEAEAAQLMATLPVMVSSTPSEQFHIFDAPALLTPLAFGPEKRFVLDAEANQSWGKIWRTITERTESGATPFVLPQSTCEQFRQARPETLRNWARGGDSTFCKTGGPEILEEIGARQLADGQLWFGKSFYDAEGSAGVGGFGYFDPGERKFTIFSPPEIRDWSASAILVEADAVWIALMRRGEYGNGGGGLLRWDRASHEVKRYDVTSVVHEMTRYRGALYMVTEDGITVLDGDHLRQYMVDVNFAGDYQVVAR